MTQIRIFALIIFTALIGVGYFVYSSETSFRLGLDLQGGTQLTYDADVAEVPANEVNARMQSLKEVIARRVSSGEVAGALGVTDPIIQTETAGFGADAHHRLIVELPGVTDIETAVNMIGQTPELDFRLANPDAPASFIDPTSTTTASYFTKTPLTGRLVERADVTFAGGGGGYATNEPIVLLDFNTEGKEIFAKITRENIGRRLGIFLDGHLLSSPVIRDQISGGTAQISGNFTIEEAQALVRDLNFGALPIPIELVNTQSIGASLGEGVVNDGVKAGMAGLMLVALFMIFWYRLPGLVGVVALGGYVSMMLGLFKLLGVTITASGIAGFILSVGMAVDANIIVFERIKEEMRSGKRLVEAIRTGFARAWAPIRDANITSMLTAIVLFYAFGQTFVRGFAVTFFLGVLVSMISAIIITRLFLLALSTDTLGDKYRALFRAGFGKE